MDKYTIQEMQARLLEMAKNAPPEEPSLEEISEMFKSQDEGTD